MKQRATADFVLPAPPNGIPSVECDLIARAVVGGKARGFFYRPQFDTFFDSAGGAIQDVALRDIARMPGQEVTYSCVYPGSGQRLALDRDLNGVLDENQSPVADPISALIALIAALLEILKLFAPSAA